MNLYLGATFLIHSFHSTPCDTSCSIIDKFKLLLGMRKVESFIENNFYSTTVGVSYGSRLKKSRGQNVVSFAEKIHRRRVQPCFYSFRFSHRCHRHHKDLKYFASVAENEIDSMSKSPQISCRKLFSFFDGEKLLNSASNNSKFRLWCWRVVLSYVAQVEKQEILNYEQFPSSRICRPSLISRYKTGAIWVSAN